MLPNPTTAKSRIIHYSPSLTKRLHFIAIKTQEHQLLSKKIPYFYLVHLNSLIPAWLKEELAS
jgi:hypothetical protein